MISYNKNIRKVKNIFALVFAIFFINTNVFAQTFEFPSATFVDSMSLRSIVASVGCDTIKVRHDNYSLMTGPKTASSFSIKSIKGLTRAKVNPFSSEVINYPQAQYILTYKTIGIRNPASSGSSTVISAIDTMNISYFLDSLKLYNDHSFKIAGDFHDLKVVVCDVFKVVDVPGTGLVYTLQTPAMYTTIPPYISVLAEIQVQKFMNYTSGSLLGSMTVDDKISTDGVVKIDLTSLNNIKPAGYEVEWTYVDKDPAITSPQYNFRNNATRIYTNSNIFNIPVAQKESYLVFRVRMVRPSTTNYISRIFGNWTITGDQGDISTLNSKQYVTINLSRNDTINWNVNTHFVEDGKYKQVMTYYDGLYKTKQSLTKFNSKPGQMIILQQLYDYQFRPVITSLPIPIYNYKKFDYFNNFLRPSTSTSYDPLTYDGFPDTTLCPLRETVVPPLQSTSEANKYYSTYKIDKSGYNSYIPDAAGYPFTRKIISPENNDKILFEGSAGEPLQIGNERHISYLYGSPLQAELNRYYGQDIGKANYYRKLIKTDNNTQDQFTITDDEGKTIMSGLTGTPDTNALALSVRKAPADSRFSTNLLSYPQIRFDDSWDENGSYFVELDANYSFDYKIKYRPFKPCASINIGLLPKVYYDYEVIDNCGNIKLSDKGALGEIGYTTSPEITYSKLSSAFLNKGNHVWNKRTFIKNSDVLASVEEYLKIPNGCFKTYNDFVKDEFLKLDLPCKSDFDPCGELKAKMMRELYPRAKYGPYTPIDYVHYKFSGPAPNSIFASYTNPFDPQPQYLYQAACLTYPDSVYSNGVYYKNLKLTPPQLFIDIFNDEIAEALLPLHPDYCKFKFCQDNQNEYDQFLAAIKNASQAKSISRFTLTDIVNNDPLKIKGLFSTTELSYLYDDTLTIAKRAFINTICGSNITSISDACTDIIKDKDETYIDTYPQNIQDEFYRNQLELYLTNRYKIFKQKLANVEDTCGPCAENRIKNPAPITWVTEEKISSYTAFSGSIPVRPYSSLFDTSGTSTSALTSLVSVGKSSYCTTKVGEIVDGLSSCNLTAAQKTILRDSLQSLYCASDSLHISSITPDWLQSFMVSLGIPVTDLCNPYLINFNSFGEDVSQGQTLGHLQYSERYYRNMEDLLINNSLLDLFRNSTSDTQSIILTPCDANPFDLRIAQKLGISTYSPSCTATASVLVIKNTNKIGESNANRLSFVHSTDTLDFYFYPKLGGDTNRLNSLTGTTAVIDSIKNIKIIPLKSKYGYDVYTQSLALRNSVFLNFQGKVGATTRNFEYFMSAFDPKKDYLSIEQDSTPNLNGIVCNEFIQLNKPVLQKAALLNIPVGHPSFNTFYTNYFNYANAVNIDIETLKSSIASCGVADSLFFPKLQAHFKLTIPKTVSTYYIDTLLHKTSLRDTFSIANMATYGDASNYYIYFDIGVAGNEIIFPKIKTAISAKLPSGSTTEMFPKLSGDTIAQIINNNWLPISSSALSAAFPTASINSTSITQYYLGHFLPTTPGNSGQIYTIRHSGSLTPYQLNHLLDSIYSFVNKYSPISVVYTNSESSVSTQFKEWQYNAWKNYVHNLPSDDHNAAIKSVRTGVLKNISASSGAYSFATSAFSYGTFNQPALINDLYIDHLPDTDTTYLYFKQLFTSLEAHNLGTFGTKSIFKEYSPGYKVTNLVTTGTETRVYKCADTSIWLVNHFNQYNLMTNVFFMAPRATLFHKSNYKLYRVQKAFSSDSFSSFNVIMTADVGSIKDTVKMLAYATLNMGRPYVIKNAIVANDPTKHDQSFFFRNCEQEKIEPIYYLARINYHNYIDSLKEIIAANFRQHIIDSLVESLDVNGNDIKHGLTLYYYDVAGNLIKTVPPGGIDTVSVIAPHNDTVNAHRLRNELVSPLIPAHNMATRYKYNAQNKVIYTSTPDGGVTNMFNDLVGRTIFSQNAKQAPLNEYTYSLYDNLSRVIETGTIIAPMGINTSYLTKSSAEFRNYIKTFARKEVTANMYDTAAYKSSWTAFAALPAQENLKNRITAVKYFSIIPAAVDGSNDTNFQQASYYSYDVLGNVSTLIHDYRQEMAAPVRFKRIDYEYDLYSGKVLMLSYNRAKADQMYQKYDYDEDNRITAAYNSNNGVYWDKDAQYKYYDHGPLARTELGDKRVQGIDFAYTINGWLKAINGIQNHADLDMGNDGANGKIMPTDVFSQRVDYFTNDYTPIDNSSKFERLSQNPKSLYNGNIAGIALALKPFDNLYQDYRYDPLQRIEKASYESYTASTAPYVIPGSVTKTGIADYRSNYSYDPNGNLLTLDRQGANIPAIFAGGTAIPREQMDNFYYKYYSGTNRLKNLSDSATATAYRIDVQKHTPDTSLALYLYDATGNLTKDVMTGLEDITWNSRGKVASIKKVDGMILNFNYDAMGNRTSKEEIRQISTDSLLKTKTIYVREASGNILAIYEQKKIFKTSTISGGGIFPVGPVTFTDMPYDIAYAIGRKMIASFTADPSKDLVKLIAAMPTMAEKAAIPEAIDLLIAEKMSDSLLAKFMKSMPQVALHTLGAGGQQVPQQSVLERYLQSIMLSAEMDTTIKDLLLTVKDANAQWYDQLVAPVPVSPAIKAAFPTDLTVLTELKRLPAYEKTGINSHLASIWTIADPSVQQSLLTTVTQAYSTANTYKDFIVDVPDAHPLLQEFRTDARLFASHQFALVNSQQLLLDSLVAMWSSSPELLLAAGDTISLSAELLSDIMSTHTDDVFKLAASSGKIDVLAEGFEHVLHTATLYDAPLTARYLKSEILSYDRLHLAEHHLYGSSRLGIQRYLPSEYTYTAKVTEASSYDRLLETRSWYSRYAHDLFDAGIANNSLTSYNLSLANMPLHQHVLGNRQLELTNHLGNVQATVLDRTNPRVEAAGNGSTITGYSANIATAQDYFPFGMYMPGRYIGDTDKHCITISKRINVLSLLPVKFFPIPSYPPVFGTLSARVYRYGDPGIPEVHELAKAATMADEKPYVYHLLPASQHAGGLVLSAAAGPDSAAEYRIDLGYEPAPVYSYLHLHPDTAQAIQGLSISISHSAGVMVEARIRQYAGAGLSSFSTPQDWHVIPDGQPYSIDFSTDYAAIAAGGATLLEYRTSPVGGTVFASATEVLYKATLHTISTYEPRDVLVTICDEKDNYRFGFNGKEKDNEVKGIANSLDFSARMYDSRTGKWLSEDPHAKSYPSLSGYSAFANNPINIIDPDGRDIIPVHGTWSNTSTWGDLGGIKTASNNLFGDNNLGVSFPWSGGNYTESRTKAALGLINYVRVQMQSKKFNGEITLVGHSHGGNVSIEALNMMVEMQEFNNVQLNLLTINTPVRDDYQLSANAVKRVSHVNVYDPNDPVQSNGGNSLIVMPDVPSNVKGTGEYGSAGRTFKNATNIEADNSQGLFDGWKPWGGILIPRAGDFHNSHNRVKDWINKTFTKDGGGSKGGNGSSHGEKDINNRTGTGTAGSR